MMSAARTQHALRALFHALLSGGFGVAYLAADENTYAMHQFAGYTVLAAIALRVLAGVLSPAGSPLALPRMRLAPVVPWLRDVLRGEPGALRARSPLHAPLSALVLVVVGAAAVTGAISDQTTLVEDLHEWLGENALLVVVVHVIFVLASTGLRRMARRPAAAASATMPAAGERG